jgi:hypothetical protein
MGEFVRTLIRLPVLIPIFYHMHVPVQDLRYTCSALWGFTLLEDVAV